jgi:hypothetical protein
MKIFFPTALTRGVILLFICTFGTMCDSKEKQRVELPFGSEAAHRLMWNWYILSQEAPREHQRLLKEYNEGLQRLRQELKDANEKISSLKLSRTDLPNVEKDEFEKTVDFERRRAALVEKNTAGLEQIIAGISSRVGEISKSIRDQELKGEPLQPKREEMPLSDNNWFCVPVSMGRYDADTEKIESMEPLSMVISPEDRVSQFEGKLSGLAMPPNVARRASQASREGNLYALFQASPETPLFFQDYQTVELKYEQSLTEKSSDFFGAVGGFLSGMASRALGNALGVEAEVNNAISIDTATNAKESISSEVRKAGKGEWKSVPIRKPGKVIKFGWKNVATPMALREWNTLEKRFETIWQLPGLIFAE